MTELVFKGQNDQVLTNSLLVAEKFGKEHKHVLDAIRELIQGCAETSADPMFVETIYVNEQNRQEYPMFVMNRDGFTLLAMGFTGKKALKFKLDYIAAFNAMEKALKEQQKLLTSAQMFAMQANINLEHEQRLENVEKRLDAMEQEREKNGKLLLSVSMSSEMLPEISLRNKVCQLVNKYASATNTKQQDVWHKVYEQLYYLYQISIHSYKKIRRDESKLEIAERNHFLDKIYIIISNLIREHKAA
jgi:Rha family phage regulatory protein